MCVVDVGVATIQLAQAGLGINAAVRNCETEWVDGVPILIKGDLQKANCAASATGVLASFQFVAFFLTSAALDCSKTFAFMDKEAMHRGRCAEASQLLLASLTVIAAAGAAIDATCKDHLFGRRLQGEDGPLSGSAELKHLLKSNASALRRDMATDPNAPFLLPKKERDADIADCVFDVGQTVFLFMRASLFTNMAVKDCSAASLYQGDNKNKAVCAADIGNIIGAFGFAAAGISAAVIHCPEWKQVTDAPCANSIINLIAAVAKAQGASAAMSVNCAPRTGRRLGSNASAPDALVV